MRSIFPYHKETYPEYGKGLSDTRNACTSGVQNELDGVSKWNVDKFTYFNPIEKEKISSHTVGRNMSHSLPDEHSGQRDVLAH